MGEQTTYRGYTIYVTNHYIYAQTPNGDEEKRFQSMSAVRAWVRRHEREHRKAVT